MVEFQKDTSRFGLAIEWEKALDIVHTSVGKGTFTLPKKDVKTLEGFKQVTWEIALFVSALYTGLSNPEDLKMAEFYETGAWIAKCQIDEQLSVQSLARGGIGENLRRFIANLYNVEVEHLPSYEDVRQFQLSFKP